jgi:hypothetical protein
MSIPALAIQPPSLRMVHVAVARPSLVGLRTARRSPRRWVQLALPEVPTDRTRKRARRVRLIRVEVSPPWKLQVEIDFPIGVRVSKREALAKIGRDPDPDAPWEETPASVRRFADYFPEGMSFAEIGAVLGTRKQQVFKIYVRALRKMLEGLGADEERIREALQAETRSAWDCMLGGV